MKVGPPRIAMIMATSAATRTLAITGQVLRNRLESHRARALDEHDVAGPQRRAQLGGGLGGGRDPVAAIVARQRADGDHIVDAELPQQRPISRW